ncbi:MAG: CvpA family protein [Candidatus Nanopelagicus sp.]
MILFDYIVLALLLISAVAGFKAGFLQTVFKAAGFIAGGVIGVAIAVNYLSKQINQLYQAGGLFLSVIICALLCEFIFGKIGLLFRGLLFIPPLKSIDSLLGAALSLLRSAVFIYLISLILVATTFSVGDKYIAPAKFYKAVDSHLPKVADDLRKQVMQLFNQLT